MTFKCNRLSEWMKAGHMTLPKRRGSESGSGDGQMNRGFEESRTFNSIVVSE